MRKYRRFVTTGELRNKRNERREYLFGIMMVVIILVGLLGKDTDVRKKWVEENVDFNVDDEFMKEVRR